MITTLFLFAAISRLPEEFYVKERPLSLITTFDISTDLEPLAVASKRVFALSPSFDLLDIDSKLLASASSHFFSWGTIADITDPGGQKIGRIEEEIWRIIPWAEYRVFNASDEIVAIAKMDLFGTEFSVFHPDFPDHIYAVISRPLIHFFRDFWTVRIYDYQVFENSLIDPRLLVMLSIYQTDKDNRDRWKASIWDAINSELYDFEGTRIRF